MLTAIDSGNGPSALILSYILHGHIPVYHGQHSDGLLHAKLAGRRDLLHLTPDVYAHFQSSLRYSTQALPINTLLDTLLRPNADTDVRPTSLVDWTYQPRRAVSHVALGNASQTGGQWVENPVTSSWEIGTLSYAEMLSLPGYSFTEHYEKTTGESMPDFQRPSRTEVASYYAAYPKAVGISSAIRTGVDVSFISRSENGFTVEAGSNIIHCEHLVLATGIFSVAIPPPPLLEPLSTLSHDKQPLLVIGSGFSAADVIISLPPNRNVIHLFNWDPEERPSPLKGCHRLAYPEYAGIYQLMKVAVKPKLIRKRSVPYLENRDWNSVYEGLANAHIAAVDLHSDGTATVSIHTSSGSIVTRTVGGLAYVVGRRGSLSYLSDALQSEILGGDCDGGCNGKNGSLISGKTLRRLAETSLEIAPEVFIIGSLAGDSLVRHAFGSCVYAAGRIMGTVTSTPQSPRPAFADGPTGEIRENGVSHVDLHLDRRKMVRNEE